MLSVANLATYILYHKKQKISIVKIYAALPYATQKQPVPVQVVA